MFFRVFEIASSLIFIAHLITFIYVVSPYSSKGWSGMGLGVLLYFVSIPVAILGFYWVSYSVVKSHFFLPGKIFVVELVIIACFVLFGMLASVSAEKAEKISETTLATLAKEKPEISNFILRRTDHNSERYSFTYFDDYLESHLYTPNHYPVTIVISAKTGDVQEIYNYADR